jgi:hypothetical protein
MRAMARTRSAFTSNPAPTRRRHLLKIRHTLELELEPQQIHRVARLLERRAQLLELHRRLRARFSRRLDHLRLVRRDLQALGGLELAEEPLLRSLRRLVLFDHVRPLAPDQPTQTPDERHRCRVPSETHEPEIGAPHEILRPHMAPRQLVREQQRDETRARVIVRPKERTEALLLFIRQRSPEMLGAEDGGHEEEGREREPEEGRVQGRVLWARI